MTSEIVKRAINRIMSPFRSSPQSSEGQNQNSAAVELTTDRTLTSQPGNEPDDGTQVSLGLDLAQGSQNALKTIVSTQWEYEEIFLQRGNTGLGFSLQSNNPQDPSVKVFQIHNGGAAEINGRLRKNDIIIQINDIFISDQGHFCDILLQSGDNVKMTVRREVPADHSPLFKGSKSKNENYIKSQANLYERGLDATALAPNSGIEKQSDFGDDGGSEISKEDDNPQWDEQDSLCGKGSLKRKGKRETIYRGSRRKRQRGNLSCDSEESFDYSVKKGSRRVQCKGRTVRKTSCHKFVSPSVGYCGDHLKDRKRDKKVSNQRQQRRRRRGN